MSIQSRNLMRTVRLMHAEIIRSSDSCVLGTGEHGLIVP